MKNIRNFLVIGSLFLAGFGPHRIEGATITVGTPGKNGGIVSWKIGNTLVEINVPKNTTAAGKAVLLRLEAEKKGFKASRTGADVKITGIKAKEIEKLKDDTNERDAVAFALPDQGKLDFHLVDTAGALTGADEDGAESIFSASLGFELGGTAYVAQSELLYSQIPGGDISSLLGLMYLDLQADLPLLYQSSLILDLPNEAINFTFPLGASSGFVDTFTSDLGGYSTLAISSFGVPDGGSTIVLLLLVGSGLLWVHKRCGDKRDRPMATA